MTVRGQHVPLANLSRRAAWLQRRIWNPVKRGSPGPISDVVKELQSSKTYQLDPKRCDSPRAAAVNPLTLDPTGNNLAAVLQGMLSGPDRKAILDLESQLHEAIPTLKGVSTPLVNQNAHQVEFTLNTDARPAITIPCSQASDGDLLTGFLVLVYGNTPQRLLVEEPENGLHPSRLKMVIDILQDQHFGNRE